MSQFTTGVLGILLGVILVIGTQFTCYKLFDEENYQKATVVGLVCLIIGILASRLIINVTT